MERRIKKLGMLLVALLFIQLAATASANKISQSSKNYLVVDKSGNGDYVKIQEAIDNAKTGSTVYVKNGEYAEVIEIDKKLTLIGESKEGTIINPLSKKNKYAIILSASGCTIETLTIKNRGPGIYTSAIRITADNNKIVDCDILDTPVGITVWSSNNIIDGCYFSGCEDEGIALIGGTHFKCDNNKIKNSVFFNNGDGIELQFSSGNIISDCKFYDNTHAGIDAIRESNNGNIISNCEIYDNGVYGIYFASSDDNQIIDCKIYANKIDNIFNRNSNNNNVTTSNFNRISERIQLIKQNMIRILSEKFSFLKSSGILEKLNSAGF